MGRANVDLATFHREYAAVFDKLTERECNMYYRNQDLPPSASTIFCRAYFKPLLLPWRASVGDFIDNDNNDYDNDNDNVEPKEENEDEAQLKP